MPRPAAKSQKSSAALGKRYPLNMRTTFEVRQKLERAAAATGRSLAQEVEHRLDRSFIEEVQVNSILDQAIKLAFGAEITGFLMEIGHIMKTKAQGDPDWCEKPATFDQVVTGVAEYFDARNPLGEKVAESTEKPKSAGLVDKPPRDGDDQ
jgi:hypothetical protein